MPASAEAEELVVPRFSGLASFIFSIFGLGVSIYLTIEHYTGSTTLACSETSTINCLKVTTSKYSHFFGIPVALLGLIFFVVMVTLCSPPAWRSRSLDPLRVGGAGVGVLTALLLVYFELFKINAICLWCTSVHICSLLLLGAVIWTSNTLRHPV